MALQSAVPMRSPNSPFEALAAFFKAQADLKPEHVVIEPLASSEHTEDPCWQWRVTQSAPKLVDKGGRLFVEKADGRLEDAGFVPLSSGVIIETPEGWLVTACNDDEEIEDQIEMVLGSVDAILNP